MVVANLFDSNDNRSGNIYEDNGKFRVEWVASTEPGAIPGRVHTPAGSFNSLEEAETFALSEGVARISRG